MRLKRWVVMLAVVGVGGAGGAYFGQAISPAPPPVVPATMAGPTESSPPASPMEAPKADLPKVADTASGSAGASRAAATVPNASGLLIEWDLGRKDGDLVPDVTGHGYDARIHGKPLLKPTWGGRPALEFDGSGDNDFWSDHPPTCGLSVAKRLGGAFSELSVEAWVRKDPSGWMPIIYRDKWDEPSGFGLYAEWSSGKAMFGHYDSAGHNSYVQSESVVQDGHWHHLVGTMQPATGEGYRYRIYVDGKLDAEQTGSWAVTEAPREGGVLMIAYPNSSGSDHPYQGGLGGMAVFDVALTPAQVKARFEAQRPADWRIEPDAFGSSESRSKPSTTTSPPLGTFLPYTHRLVFRLYSR